MRESQGTQDQSASKIDELRMHNSLLETENQSSSDLLWEMARFKIISDSAEQGNAIVDLGGKIVYINDYFAEKHGYTPEELLGGTSPYSTRRNRWKRLKRSSSPWLTGADMTLWKLNMSTKTAPNSPC